MNPGEGNTALVIGATGLVGSHLVQILLAHPSFNSVIIFVRHPSGIIHRRLTEHIVDFNRPEQWKALVVGDILFSALGTTLKKAGSKAAQYTVDYTYQYEFASAAASNGVAKYVLISSAGASERSFVFYSRIKGQLEKAVTALPFRQISILRPGFLEGKRKEKRPFEKLMVGLMRAFNAIGLFRKYRPVPAGVVAKAMINAALYQNERIKIWESTELFDLASRD